MKVNCLIYIFCFLLFPLQLVSQNTEDFSLSKSIGIDVIPQYTSLMNQQDADANNALVLENNIGFQAGLNYSMALNSYVGWRLEAHYASHNQAYAGAMGDTTLVAKTNQQFFKPAVQLQLSSNRNQMFSFNFYVGPQAMILTSYKDDVEFTANGVAYGSIASGKSVLIKQATADTTLGLSHTAYTAFDIGIASGLGLNYNLSEQFIVSLNVRADVGMGDAEHKRAKFLNSSGNISNTDYWVGYSSKYNRCSNNSFELCPPRTTTTRVSAGIHLGVQYKL